MKTVLRLSGIASLVLGSAAFADEGSVETEDDPAVLAGENWFKASNGATGDHPVLAGHEKEVPIYVCRVSGHAGKLHSLLGKCYYGWHGREFESTEYDVLQDPNRSLQWVDRNKASEDAIVTAGTEGNDVIKICRPNHHPSVPGHDRCGKLVGGLGGVCYSTMNGYENGSRSFEVLAVQPPRRTLGKRRHR